MYKKIALLCMLVATFALCSCRFKSGETNRWVESEFKYGYQTYCLFIEKKVLSSWEKDRGRIEKLANKGNAEAQYKYCMLLLFEFYSEYQLYMEKNGREFNDYDSSVHFSLLNASDDKYEKFFEDCPATSQQIEKMKSALKIAPSYLKKAAEQGYAPAQTYYAIWLAIWADVTQKGARDEGSEDLKEAFAWGIKAAEQNDIRAQKFLAYAYENALEEKYSRFFDGVRNDAKEGFIKWGHKAAEQGDMEAQYALGASYAEGKLLERNAQEALKWYLKAAEQGNTKAINSLARGYEKGEFGKQDAREAVKWWLKSAEKGDVDAMRRLGVIYKNGFDCVKKNTEEAKKWFRKAADQDSFSCYELGCLTQPSDPAEAVNLWRKAAEARNSKACYRMGEYYRDPQAVGIPDGERDMENAIEWYEKSEEPEAYAQLAHVYFTGDGVPRDYEAAAKMGDKAAKEENEIGQFILASCYQSGLGIGKDEKKAKELFQKAAEKGHAGAQYMLGQCYERGSDEKEALRWYRKAGDQENAAAQYALGQCYERGASVQKNEKEALRWYRKAADQENADAQYSLGLCYECGIAVEKNEKEAIKWFLKAAEQWHDGAQCKLGEIYKEGLCGVEKNKEEAIKWFRKATAQDNAKACYELGCITLPSNAMEAVKLWEKAARLGEVNAQFRMGEFYRAPRAFGISTISRNMELAVKWYELAASNPDSSVAGMAEERLAQTYFTGDGIPHNYILAVQWGHQAAKRGRAIGQIILALCYQAGAGVEQNDKEAVKWFRKAAEQGNKEAQYYLGLYYLKAKEKDEALKWLRKSAAQGCKEAQLLL